MGVLRACLVLGSGVWVVRLKGGLACVSCLGLFCVGLVWGLAYASACVSCMWVCVRACGSGVCVAWVSCVVLVVVSLVCV